MCKKLHKDILNLENPVLKKPLSVKKILKGEVKIPDLVKNFYKALYTGEDEAKTTVSSRKSRFVESSASDTKYSCSRGGGGVLPGKHLSLGFEIKALTGSKTFVTLMNRYGHCASSETIRRIYTSLEATINDKETLCLMELENYPSSREPTTNDKENVVPDGIRKLPYL